MEQIRERCCDERGAGWIEDVVADVRYGARMLGRTPTFTLAALATLALVACWLPARRAAKVDPMTALRAE